MVRGCDLQTVSVLWSIHNSYQYLVGEFRLLWKSPSIVFLTQKKMQPVAYKNPLLGCKFHRLP